MKKITLKIFATFLIFGLLSIVSTKRASAAACIPVSGMGSVTNASVSAIQPGTNSVWVRIQSATPTAINLNIEATPSGGVPSCFSIKSPNPTASTIWTWVNAGSFAATATGNSIKLLGVDPGVRVDRVIIFPTSSTCTPSNVRVTTGTPSEPGDNCVPVSPPPPTTTDTVAPIGPSSVTTTAQSTSQINLTWPAATDNVGVKNYEIYRNGSLIGTSTTTVYADSGLAAGTSYSYKVLAVDAAGNKSPGAVATGSTQSAPAPDTTAPTPPAGLTSGIVLDSYRSAYYVDLNWKASTDNIGVKDYIVKKNGVNLGTTTTLNYKDYSIQPDVYYTYQVQARDAAGNVSAVSSTTIVGRCFLWFCWKG